MRANCYCWLRGSGSCHTQPHPPEACHHWNFGAMQVHGGSSEDHPSSRPCFVEDGLIGSLHKCSSLDGADEKFAWRGRRGGAEVAEPDNGPLAACHLRWWVQIPTLPDRWQAKVASFTWWARCQAYRIQAGGGSVHDWGAFHSGARSALVRPDQYLTSELYRGILQNTLVPFARQHFRDNYNYQNDNATPHRAWVAPDFLQQGNITKVTQSARSPDFHLIDHIWDELGRAVTSMDNPPHNLGGLRQTQPNKWADIHAECPQRLVASMPWSPVANILARGGNIQYWPSIHKTTAIDLCAIHYKYINQ